METGIMRIFKTQDSKIKGNKQTNHDLLTGYFSYLLKKCFILYYQCWKQLCCLIFLCKQWYFSELF